MKTYKRGNVVWVDFGKGIGSEQGGMRPALIVQNDIGNKYSPTLIVIPLSTSSIKASLPTHSVMILGDKYNVALGEQIRVIDKKRVKSDVIHNISDMSTIDETLRISIGL